MLPIWYYFYFEDVMQKIHQPGPGITGTRVPHILAVGVD